MSTRPVINLANYHFRQRHGDIEVFGTWFMYDDDEEPCLVLMRLGDHGRDPERGITPCIVRLRNAWLYDEERGEPEAAATEVYGIVQALGLGEGPMQPFRILSIIRDHLADLKNMPPRPDIDRKVTADILMTNLDTGKVKHYEVSDDV